MKFTGIALILVGCLYICYQFSRTSQRQQALLWDLAIALELLESSIRWKQITIPEGLRELSARKISGCYFFRIKEEMADGSTLQAAWNNAFLELPSEESGILCHVELTGDLQQLQGSLHLASRQLLKLHERRQRDQRQREKLCAALSISAGGLLIITLS